MTDYSSMVQGMVMMQAVPIMERMIKDPQRILKLIRTYPKSVILAGILYLLYKSGIVNLYLMSRIKYGVTYKMTLFFGTRSCRMIADVEIEAILHDLFVNCEQYRIAHFTKHACESQGDDECNWSDTSKSYDNYISTPTSNEFSIKFKPDGCSKSVTIYFSKTEETNGCSSTSIDTKKTDEKIGYTFNLYVKRYGDKHFINDYVKQCIESHNKHKYDINNKHPWISHRSNEEDRIINTKFTTNVTFDSVFVDPKIISDIKQKIEDVITEAPYFKCKGIPRKFFALLHGPPGTGKSSIIKAALNHCQIYDKVRHIMKVDLSAIENKDKAFEVFIDTDRRIFIFEEIDRASCILNKDSSKPNGNNIDNSIDITELAKLSKEEILEKIKKFKPEDMSQSSGCSDKSSSLKIEDIIDLFDGLPELDGYIILATTNNIDKIEPRFRRRFKEYYIGHQTDAILKKQLEFYYDTPGFFSKNEYTLPSGKWTGCDVEKHLSQLPTIEEAIKRIQEQ